MNIKRQRVIPYILVLLVALVIPQIASADDPCKDFNDAVTKFVLEMPRLFSSELTVGRFDVENNKISYLVNGREIFEKEWHDSCDQSEEFCKAQITPILGLGGYGGLHIARQARHIGLTCDHLIFPSSTINSFKSASQPWFITVKDLDNDNVSEIITHEYQQWALDCGLCFACIDATAWNNIYHFSSDGNLIPVNAQFPQRYAELLTSYKHQYDRFNQDRKNYVNSCNSQQLNNQFLALINRAEILAGSGEPTSLAELGPNNVWSFKENHLWEDINKKCEGSGGFSAWRSSTKILSIDEKQAQASFIQCIASQMQKAGASQQAIAFTKQMKGEVYMGQFREMGKIDLAMTVAPVLNDPNVEDFILVNGTPRIVYLWDNVKEIVLTRDPLYQSLRQKYPDITMWPMHSFMEMQNLAQGGQRFLFDFMLLNGCRGCDIAGYADIAFDFDGNGIFTGTKLLRLNGVNAENLANAITFTPTALVFGSVDVGRPADLAITVQNTGGGTLTGSCNTAAPFSLPNGCSFNLGSGQSAVVTVRFSPTAIGPITGNVEFTSNMGNASIDLSGTGAQPLAGITLSTNNLSFGTQAIGSTGTAKPVTIINNSTSLVRFGLVNLTGTNTSDFFFSKYDRDCSYRALRPKDSCTIGVAFKPSAPGERVATITIRSDATGSPHSVQLSGTGAEAKVLLLLHGMNATPSTWDEFVGANFSHSCPVVYGRGEIINDAVPNSNGVYCYRLMFGSLDSRSGRLGLEGLSGDTITSGDWETFDMLGQEVRNAVQAIKQRHPYAGIVLVGHSRGGIAARVFLQKESYPERMNIIGLLTIGTPHRGTPLARIYPYLELNSRNNCCWLDWTVIDFMRGAQTCFTFTNPYPVDLRRPTIQDLADNSSEITKLNLKENVDNLPESIKYGELSFTGIDLGEVPVQSISNYTVTRYSIFSYIKANYQVCYWNVSPDAKNVILGVNVKPSKFTGDGIVPASSQKYTDLTGFPVNAKTFPKNGGALSHMEEPKQTPLINDLLLKMMGTWWTSAIATVDLVSNQSVGKKITPAIKSTPTVKSKAKKDTRAVCNKSPNVSSPSTGGAQGALKKYGTGTDGCTQ